MKIAKSVPKAKLAVLLLIVLILVSCQASEALVEETIQVTPIVEGNKSSETPNYITSVRRLTDNSRKDYLPAWSPDGEWIVYVAEEKIEGKIEIELYAMPVDGSEVTQLTDVELENISGPVSPDWSPDGKEIIVDVYEGRGQIFKLDFYQALEQPLGLEEMEILIGFGEDMNASGPVWSPDGAEIAFDYLDPQSSGDQIGIMDANGQNARPLTDIPDVRYSFLDWSPDGTKLIFNSTRALDHDLFIMEVNTGEVNPITLDAKDAHSAHWSPDGTKIVFGTRHKGNFDLFVLYLDSGEVRRLTYHLSSDLSASWSPDSSQIVFVSDRDGNPELYIMDVP